MSFDITFVLRIVGTAVIAYLLGSLNFAVILTRKNEKDIRTMGSGNAGFTNMLRSVGTGPAVLTFVFDFLNGAIAVAIGWWIFSGVSAADGVTLSEYTTYGRYLAGLFAIIGHMFPLYFGFKGGKGVVTTSALMAVVDWRVFLMIITTFLIIFFCTKIISLGSCACAALYGVYTCIATYFFDYLPRLGQPELFRFRYVILSTIAATVIGLLVLVKHKDNIGRLFRGEEKRITPKKKKQTD